MKLPFLIYMFIAIAGFTNLDNLIASHLPIHHNPQSYILTKFQSQDIVFLGTRHKQPPILQFISDLIPKLHHTGVTHIGLEIASDK